MEAALTPREINRATLARQMLLARERRTVLETVGHLLGMQAQAPNPPYYGLWSRLEGFEPQQLSTLIETRQVVRIAAMRSTVHLLTAQDALLLRDLVQPVLERAFKSSTFGKELVAAGADPLAIADAVRVLVEAGPRTGTQLAEALAPRWPGLTTATLQNTARTFLPLVQVPPRGLWGRSGQPTLTTTRAWLGTPAAPDMSTAARLDEMVLRYLAAFGPASVADIQAWSGLTRLSEVIERLRPRLISFAGRPALFDLPDAPRPAADTPAPARLLAEFDNLTLSYADRSRVLADDDRKRVYTANGIIPGMVMIDGMVEGSWKLRPAKASAGDPGITVLDVMMLRPARAADRHSIEAEAARLLMFAAPATAHDIQFRAAS